MAYTNTPEKSTHQVRRIPIIGGETIASNVTVGVSEAFTPIYQGARFINCYPKRMKLDNTDDQWVLTKVPPLVSDTKTFTSSGTDPIRCVSSDGLFLWKGRRLYNTDYSPALVYTAGGDYYVKSMFKVVNPSGTDDLYAGILKDAGSGLMYSYTYNATTVTFTLSASVSFLENSDNDPFQSLFYNGRLFCVGNDKRIYNTPPGVYTTWNSTSYIVPEARGDETVAIALYKSHLVAFSEFSIEFFYDGSIEIGSPLVRQDAYTQLFGVKSPNNIAQSGDYIFFLSYEYRYGYGVYVFDNFQTKKISNFYVDGVLNNDDITASAPFATQLYIVDFFGDPCLIFNCGFAGSLYVEDVYVNPVYVFEATSTTGYPFLAFSTKQAQWFDFVFSDADDYDWVTEVEENPGFFQMAAVSQNEQWQTYFVASYASSGVTNFKYLTKDYNPSGYGNTAEVVFDTNDFGVNYYKHIKTVDAIGDFGNNTVGLAWTPNYDYSNWSSYAEKEQSSLGYQNALRWYNLGRHRTSAFRIRFQGNSNVMLKGLEVGYNLGSL